MHGAERDNVNMILIHLTNIKQDNVRAHLSTIRLRNKCQRHRTFPSHESRHFDLHATSSCGPDGVAKARDATI